MRISDWSSDVCSSDLKMCNPIYQCRSASEPWYCSDDRSRSFPVLRRAALWLCGPRPGERRRLFLNGARRAAVSRLQTPGEGRLRRSEEHTSELQSLMRISYAVFCLKKKKKRKNREKKAEYQ